MKSPKPGFVEGVHWYYNKQGMMVLTERYHTERGWCCGNGCVHCPYHYINVPEPKRSHLLSNEKNKNA